MEEILGIEDPDVVWTDDSDLADAEDNAIGNLDGDRRVADVAGFRVSGEGLAVGLVERDDDLRGIDSGVIVGLGEVLALDKDLGALIPRLCLGDLDGLDEGRRGIGNRRRDRGRAREREGLARLELCENGRGRGGPMRGRTCTATLSGFL